MTKEDALAKVRGCLTDYFSLDDANEIDEIIKALEQKSILDKIRDEIEQTAKDYDKFDDYRRKRGLWIALDIIDKNSAESEG